MDLWITFILFIDGKVASGTSAHAGHVMLSYQWDNQETVKKIAKYLKEEGYNVWIDINNMGENILEGMAHAVEQADVIIVCISSKYKKSANTRAGILTRYISLHILTRGK